MSFGICPNCINQLTESSALMTKPSSIFKGNNVYLMCKNCQQVLLYNRDRDLIFDLDEYKDDDEILNEINTLLSEIDKHYEVSPPCEACQHDCSKCEGCDTQYKRSSNKERKSVHQEPEPEKNIDNIPDIELIVDALSNNFLIVNKADPSQKKILTQDDFKFINIDEWLFFELQHVIVNPIISYEIVRQ